jgi:hypothetical protein
MGCATPWPVEGLPDDHAPASEKEEKNKVIVKQMVAQDQSHEDRLGLIEAQNKVLIEK